MKRNPTLALTLHMGDMKIPCVTAPGHIGSEIFYGYVETAFPWLNLKRVRHSLQFANDEDYACSKEEIKELWESDFSDTPLSLEDYEEEFSKFTCLEIIEYDFHVTQVSIAIED